MACRSELERLQAEVARANTGLQEGQRLAAEVEARAKERQQAVQELKADIEQLKDQLATGDQSVQVQTARVLSLSQDSSSLCICFAMCVWKRGSMPYSKHAALLPRFESSSALRGTTPDGPHGV